MPSNSPDPTPPPQQQPPPLTTAMEIPPPNDAPSNPTFSPLVYDKLNRKVFNEAIERLITRASAAKQTLSGVSRSYASAIHMFKLAEDILDNVDDGYPNKAFQATLAVIDAGAGLIETHLDIIEGSIKLLVDEFNQGTLDIPNSAKEKELIDLEKKGRELRTQLVVRRSQRWQMAGEIVDKLLLRDAEVLSFDQDWSYIDQLVLRYRTPETATLDIFRQRDPEAEKRFSTAVLEAYSNEEETRCVITGKVMTVTAAQIVPHHIGEANASYLFRPSTHEDGHIMSPQNGLPMLKILKDAYDQGKFTIVPGDDMEKDDWKVLVLDEAFGELFEQDYEPLQNRALTFQTDFRPGTRYLYFAHLIAILQRQRYECTGWWKDFPFANSPGVWEIPWEYLRTSALMDLARRVGHVASKDAAKILRTVEDKSSRSSERERLFSDIVNLCPRGVGGGAAGSGLDDDEADL